MSDDDHRIDWNIKLDFDLHAPKRAAPPAPPKPKVPPRDLLKEKFPRILERITLLWGSKELHAYFEQTLFMNRSGRQGFPPEVMAALGELYNEHQQLLMRHGIIRQDVWDMQFGGGTSGKPK